MKPATRKQCWLQYKELHSWVLLAFILVLHFKNPFINCSALAAEPGECMLGFAGIAAQPSGGEGRDCAKRVWLPAPHRALCASTALPTSLQKSPSQGMDITAFILWSPESLVMFAALNQTHLVSSCVSISTRSFLVRGVSEMLRNIKWWHR